MNIWIIESWDDGNVEFHLASSKRSDAKEWLLNNLSVDIMLSDNCMKRNVTTGGKHYEITRYVTDWHDLSWIYRACRYIMKRKSKQ